MDLKVFALLSDSETSLVSINKLINSLDDGFFGVTKYDEKNKILYARVNTGKEVKFDIVNSCSSAFKKVKGKYDLYIFDFGFDQGCYTQALVDSFIKLHFNSGRKSITLISDNSISNYYCYNSDANQFKIIESEDSLTYIKEIIRLLLEKPEIHIYSKNNDLINFVGKFIEKRYHNLVSVRLRRLRKEFGDIIALPGTESQQIINCLSLFENTTLIEKECFSHNEILSKEELCKEISLKMKLESYDKCFYDNDFSIFNEEMSSYNLIREVHNQFKKLTYNKNGKIILDNKVSNKEKYGALSKILLCLHELDKIEVKNNKKVIISYFNTGNNRDGVIDLAYHLLSENIDVRIDLFHECDPSLDWVKWMQSNIDSADKVIIYLPYYFDDTRRKNGKGKGSFFEKRIIENKLLDEYFVNSKFIFMLPNEFDRDDEKHVSMSIKNYNLLSNLYAISESILCAKPVTVQPPDELLSTLA